MFIVATECGGRTAAGRRRASRNDSLVKPQFSGPGTEELEAMAQGLAATARQWPGLADLTSRRWELLAASDTFEAWVIGWPPDGTISLHDHGDSAGAVAVAGGELVETLITEDVDGSVSTSRRR